MYSYATWPRETTGTLVIPYFDARNSSPLSAMASGSSASLFQGEEMR
jgi:hypothetical protein